MGTSLETRYDPDLSTPSGNSQVYERVYPWSMRLNFSIERFRAFARFSAFIALRITD